MADGRTLLFVNTASNPNAGNPLTGRLYTVPVQPDGAPGALTQVWESLPVDAPDGLAIAESGNVYVALAGTSQVLMLSPQFAELARTPPDPVANQAGGDPARRARAASPSSATACSSPTTRRSAATRRAGRSSTSSPASAGLPLHYPRIFRRSWASRCALVRRPAPTAIRLRVRVTRNLAAIEVPVEGAKVGARGRAQRTRTGAAAARLRLERSARRALVVRARKPGFEPAARCDGATQAG